MTKEYVMESYDGRWYHVWTTTKPPQTGVVTLPWDESNHNHKQFTRKRGADNYSSKLLRQLSKKEEEDNNY